jgi:hypothetical protein
MSVNDCTAAVAALRVASGTVHVASGTVHVASGTVHVASGTVHVAPLRCAVQADVALRNSYKNRGTSRAGTPSVGAHTPSMHAGRRTVSGTVHHPGEYSATYNETATTVSYAAGGYTHCGHRCTQARHHSHCSARTQRAPMRCCCTLHCALYVALRTQRARMRCSVEAFVRRPHRAPTARCRAVPPRTGRAPRAASSNARLRMCRRGRTSPSHASQCRRHAGAFTSGSDARRSPRGCAHT